MPSPMTPNEDHLDEGSLGSLPGEFKHNHSLKQFWYNYVTESYDERRTDDVLTDADALQYIPQDRAAHGIYECKRAMGLSVLDAMGEVLIALAKCASRPR